MLYSNRPGVLASGKVLEPISTPRRSLVADSVHTRTTGSLNLHRDPHLEPLGSRTLLAAAPWDTLLLLHLSMFQLFPLLFLVVPTVIVFRQDPFV